MTEDEIWIVDDDTDDHDLIKEIVIELSIPNKIQLFDTSADFLRHLDKAPRAPFMILSDINLPGVDGLMLREKMLAEPNKKYHGVPFIFWSNAASEQQIERAYKLRAHGFFIKETSFQQWKETFILIIRYWTKSKMPRKSDKPDFSLT